MENIQRPQLVNEKIRKHKYAMAIILRQNDNLLQNSRKYRSGIYNQIDVVLSKSNLQTT